MRVRILLDKQSKIYLRTILALIILMSLLGLGYIVAQSPLFIVSPDQPSYTVNETVEFFVNTSEPVQLRVTVDNNTYLFAGEPNTSVEFLPQEPGFYTVELVSGALVVASGNFTVVALPEALVNTTPANTTPANVTAPQNFTGPVVETNKGLYELGEIVIISVRGDVRFLLITFNYTVPHVTPIQQTIVFRPDTAGPYVIEAMLPSNLTYSMNFSVIPPQTTIVLNQSINLTLNTTENVTQNITLPPGLAKANRTKLKKVFNKTKKLDLVPPGLEKKETKGKSIQNARETYIGNGQYQVIISSATPNLSAKSYTPVLTLFSTKPNKMSLAIPDADPADVIILNAELLDSSGGSVDVTSLITPNADGEFELDLKPGREFRPGLYSLKVDVSVDGVVQQYEQDFAWGVLAVNTHKSIYSPGEEAFISLGVLNELGQPLCNADVDVTLTAPDKSVVTLSTLDGTITISDTCALLAYTEMPDYYGYYDTSDAGLYIMDITAVTANGMYSITDAFLVEDIPEFDVERQGPTRIYPVDPYNMTFVITPTANYTGTVTEYVPDTFAITPQGGLTVQPTADALELTWDVNFTAGDMYTLQYEFDAPDISPEFYTLGPLRIGLWEEAREWQIASDDTHLANATTCYEDNLGASGYPTTACDSALTATHDNDNTYETLAPGANDYSSVMTHHVWAAPVGCTLTQVQACYVWWHSDVKTCQGTYYTRTGGNPVTQVSAACLEADPSDTICTDITAGWATDCSDFAVDGDVKLYAQAQASGPGETFTVDLFQFNVTYTIAGAGYPNWSIERVNPEPYQGQLSQFNVTWHDDDALSHYRFSHNASGTWVDSDWIAFTGTTKDYSINDTTFYQEPGTLIAWHFTANDSGDRLNETDNFTFVVGGVKWNHSGFTIPTAEQFTAQPSNTVSIEGYNNNTDVNISCTIGDCTVIWFNVTKPFSVNGSTAEVQFNCSTDTPGFFSANFSVISQNDTLPHNVSVNCTITEDTYPTWITVGTNHSPIYQYDTVLFNATWDDDNNLSRYWFGINQSGDWFNSSAESFPQLSLTGNFSVNETRIVAEPGTNISWIFFANDTVGYENRTYIQQFIVAGIIWNQTTLDLGTANQYEPWLENNITIEAYAANANVVVTCYEGDCSEIRDNFSDNDNLDEEFVSVLFNCSTEAPGVFNANFSVVSTVNDNNVHNLSVTCTVLPDIYPNWSNPLVVPEPYQGQLAQFNMTWHDDVGLSHYNFSHNASGTWVDTGWIAFSTTQNYSINNTIFYQEPGTLIAWRFAGNDSVDQFNVSDNFTFVLGGVKWNNSGFTIPSAEQFTAQPSNTVSIEGYNNNTYVNVSCAVGDCTVIWFNVTEPFSVNGSTAEVQFNCSTDTPGFFSANFSVISQNDTLPHNVSVNCTITPDSYPAWSNELVIPEVYQGLSSQFNVTWTDGNSLSHYNFSYNGSGTWVHTGWIAFTGTTQDYSINDTTFYQEPGTLISWRFAANDSVDQENITSNFTFVVGGVKWNQSGLTIASAAQFAAQPSNTVKIEGYNNNTNVNITCYEGDCGVIWFNVTAGEQVNGTTALIQFNCSTANFGTFSANFSVNSSNDTLPHNLSVNCIITEDIPPNWTEPFVTPEPYQGRTSQFNVTWQDDASLSHHSFSHNASGTWVDSDWVSFGGTLNSSINDSIFYQEPGTLIAWHFRVNDSANQFNESDNFTFVLGGVKWNHSGFTIPTARQFTAQPSNTVSIEGYNNNTDVNISCAVGDCTTIWFNVTEPFQVNGTVAEIQFNCSTDNFGFFSANFSVISQNDTLPHNISVNCTITEDTYPNWSIERVTPEPYQGQSAQFNVTWHDDVGLSHYNFSHNASGTWLETGWIPFSSTQNYSINDTIFYPEPGTLIAWRFAANDSADQFNVTDNFTFVLGGVKWNHSGFTIPTAEQFTAQPSNTVKIEGYNNNTYVNISCAVGDCTIIWFNVTEPFSVNGSVAEIQFNCSTDTPGFFSANFSVISQNDTLPHNVSVNCTITDDTFPTYASVSANQSPIYQFDDVRFNGTWNDDNGMSHFWFGINETGDWFNTSRDVFPQAGASANFSLNVTRIFADPGTNVSWLFFANDSADQENRTSVYSFIVGGIIWNQTTLDLGTTSQYYPWLESEVMVEAYLTNAADVVNCYEGDCAEIMHNYTDNENPVNRFIAVQFNCSTEASGTFNANFSIKSFNDPDLHNISVTCVIKEDVYPYWSNELVTPEPYQGHYVQFNVSWTDDLGLSMWNFSMNRTGSWLMEPGAAFVDQTANHSLFNYTFYDEPGTLISWNFEVNDTGNKVNMTTNFTFIMGGVKWNDSGLTIATAEQFTAQPTNTVKIEGYNNNSYVMVTCIEGDCGNITANFTNGEAVNGTTALVQFNCSTDAYGTFSANFSVNSTNDTLPHNISVNCTIDEDMYPAWSDELVIPEPYQGQSTQFNVTWTDDNAMSHYNFSTNASGTWLHTGWIAFTGTTQDYSINDTVFYQEPGTLISWRFAANDSHDYENITSNFTFVLGGVKWNQSALSIATAEQFTTQPVNTVKIEGYNNNTDVNISCTVGDCTNIWFNVTEPFSVNGSVAEVQFNCSTATYGTFSANFSVISQNDTLPHNLSVSCTITADTFPAWSNELVTPEPYQGQSTQFNVTWTDDNALSHYNFSTNASGTWLHTGWLPLGSTSNYSINDTIFYQEAGTLVSWRFVVNDSADQENFTTNFTFVLGGVKWNQSALSIATAEQFTAQPTNTVKIEGYNNNTYVNISCAVGDCTTIWFNVTEPFSVNGSVAEVQFNCSTLTPGTFSANFSVISQNDTLPHNLSVSCTITEDTYPAWSNELVIPEPYQGQSTQFNVTWTDDNALSHYNFSSNASGTWLHTGWIAFTGTTQGYSINDTIFYQEPGTLISWRFAVNDSHDYENITSDFTFVLGGVKWNQSALSIATAEQFTAQPINTVKIEGYNNNTDVNISCTVGDCTNIWFNVTEPFSVNGSVAEIQFNCSTDSYGTFSANFSVISQNDTLPHNLSVSCTITADTFPAWSNPFINASPYQGHAVRFNVTWTDDNALSHYNFSTNASGTWEHTDWLPLGDTSNHTVNESTFYEEAGTLIAWRFTVNDSRNQENQSTEFNFTMGGVKWNETSITIPTAEQYTAQSTYESAILGYNNNTDVIVNCMVGDCGNITYNFTSGDDVNETTTSMQFNCSTDTAGTYEANFSVNSTQDLLLHNVTVTCTITDDTYPTWSNAYVNQTVYQYDTPRFNVTWADDNGLVNYLFAVKTTVWGNASWLAFSIDNYSTAAPNTVAEPGTYVEWMFFANDSVGQENRTDVFNFIVGGVKWNQSGVIIPVENKSEDNQVVDVNLTGYLNNTVVNVSCSIGNCGNITHNFTSGDDLNDSYTLVQFNCSTSHSGNFTANFTVNSTQDNFNHKIWVNCTITNRYPHADEPQTWDNATLLSKSTFERNESIYVNVSITDPDTGADIDTVMMTVTNSSGHTFIDNQTMLQSWSINNGFLYNSSLKLTDTSDEGIWTIIIFANDTDNAEHTNTTTFTVDDTIPPASVTGLGNFSQTENSIWWNWTNPPDLDYSHVEIWLNGTHYWNITVTDSPNNSTNITGLDADKCYEIQTRTVDTALNINTTWVNDTACTSPTTDVEPPSIANVSNTSVTDQTVNISWDTNENADTRVEYGVTSGAYTDTYTDVTDVPFHNVTLSGFAPSTLYFYIVNSTDAAGNSNRSIEFNFTTLADATPPAWSAPWNYTPSTYSPTNLSQFNISWQDFGTVANVTIELNISGTYTNYSVYNLTGFMFNLSINLPAGNHTWRSYANDTLSNENVSSVWTFVIAKAAPLMNLSLNGYDTNTSVDEDVNFYLNGTIIAGDSATALELYVNGTLLTTAHSPVSNLTNLSDPGLYNVTVIYSSSENYSRGTITQWLTVNDTTPPNVTLNAPSDFHNTSGTTLTFNWTPGDNVDGANLTCNLTIDSAVNVTITGLTRDVFHNVTLTSIGSGLHWWNVTCYDLALNTNTSETRNFTIVGSAGGFNITVSPADNMTVQLNWSAAAGADSYNIYFSSDLSSGFGAVADISGITDTNYTDGTSTSVDQRYYNITSVKGGVETPIGSIVGMHRITLDAAGSRWNLVSLPLQLFMSRLQNSTHSGYDLALNTAGCIEDIWQYNGSRATTWEFSSWSSGGAWTPASGSENFTHLEAARGYWVYMNDTLGECKWTIAGEVPLTSTDHPLIDDFNVVGWYSVMNASLPLNCTGGTCYVAEPPYYPLRSSPVNAITRLYYYNSSSDSFKKTDHYSVDATTGYGWWPAMGSDEFTSLLPGLGYYLKSLGASTWTVNSSVE